MYNQLSNVIYLPYGHSSEENGRYVYDELMKNVIELIEYAKSKNMEKILKAL